MCGIAGILGRIDDRNREALARMSRALAHRGPDGTGSWESTPDAEGRGALLTFRRLAILDLSPAGDQPMVDPVGGEVLLFNGEVFNFRALRAELEAEGQRFRSTGDAAVVLRLLATRGPDALARLRGMFGLALWSPDARSLLLARDPLGIKPLYVARSTDPASGWTLAFASELRALLASGLLGTPRLDPGAVASLLWNGFVVGPGTTVSGVSSLLPGELQLHRADGTRLRAERYWSLPPSTHSGPVGEEELAQVLTESVRLHLVSDVPLGVFLSGGIDSSAVANLARRGGEAAVHTFTLAFEEPEWNEGPVARQIARAIGTEHREVLLTESDFVGQLEPALDSIDQPTFDGLNSHAMSRAVRQAGFTVALVGTGGDELFGGYPSFRELSRLHLATAWLPSPSRTALAALAARALATLRPAHPDVPRQTRWAKLPAMVRRADDLLALYQLAYALFLPGFQEALLGGEVPPGWSDGVPAPFRAELDRETAHRSDLATIGVLEQRLFLGERLLRDSDAASMAASLELRLPLVDVEVLRTVLGLGDRERFRPLMRKEALRRVGLEGLPPELFTRPKQGFVLPYERWIRRGLGTSIDATLRDAEAVRAAGLAPAAVERLWRGYQDGAPGLYWSRIWALYVLVRWCQQHGVRS